MNPGVDYAETQFVLREVFALGSGLAVTVAIGLIVGWCFLGGQLSGEVFLEELKQEDKEGDWAKAAVILDTPFPATFGLMEQMFFFIAFWWRMPELGAGWLLFKLGSKWEAWANIIKVPDCPKGVPGFHLRNRFGSWLLQRWLLGTLGNVLAAVLGVLMARSLKPQ